MARHIVIKNHACSCNCLSHVYLKTKIKVVHCHGISLYSRDVQCTGSFERMVFLNKDDIKMAIKRFGHPESRNIHPPRVSSKMKKMDENGRKKPIGGVSVLLTMPSKPSPPPKPQWIVKQQVVQQVVADTENFSDSLGNSDDDEYISMSPAPLKASQSFDTVDNMVDCPQSDRGRKISAPEILLHSVLHSRVDGTQNNRNRSHSGPQTRVHDVRGRPRRSRTPQGTQLHSGASHKECSSLDLPYNRRFTQATLQVHGTSSNGLSSSRSVPNLLLDMQMSPSQSQSRSVMKNQSLAHSSEDLYEEVQDVLSIDSPLLHRISAFSPQDDRSSSSCSSDCGSCSGSSGDLTSTHQTRKKVQVCFHYNYTLPVQTCDVINV